MKNYIIDPGKTVYSPEDAVKILMEKFCKEGDLLGTDPEQYEALLRIRLVQENLPEVHLVIGGEEICLHHPKEKKLTAEQRISILEKQVKKLTDELEAIKKKL